MGGLSFYCKVLWALESQGIIKQSWYFWIYWWLNWWITRRLAKVVTPLWQTVTKLQLAAIKQNEYVRERNSEVFSHTNNTSESILELQSSTLRLQNQISVFPFAYLHSPLFNSLFGDTEHSKTCFKLQLLSQLRQPILQRPSFLLAKTANVNTFRSDHL